MENYELSPLETITKKVKAAIWPTLKIAYKQKRVKLTKECVKIDFFQQFCSLTSAELPMTEQMVGVKFEYLSEGGSCQPRLSR